MYEKKVSGVFIAMACCLFSFAFVACDDDDNNGYNGNPLSVTAVRGEYAGATIKAGDADTTVTVSVNADSVKIADFPVDGIVAAVVPSADLSEALSSVGSVPFAAGYDGSVIGTNIVMPMVADSLQFTVTAAGQEHSVKVGFAADASGLYSGSDSTFTFTASAETVIFDGDTVKTFSPIEYVLSPAKKGVAGGDDEADVPSDGEGDVAGE